MELIYQSTAKRVLLKAYLSSDHISPATGKTIAVVISKNGAAFANPSAGATNATEIASGWYYVDLSATDTGTAGPLIVRGTCTGVDDSEAGYTVGYPLVGLKKNTALNNFEFLMIDSADHVSPKTALTVTAQVSIDGGTFAACANSVTEVSNGIYKINLAAADLNGDIITLKFTATGADPRYVTIRTTA